MKEYDAILSISHNTYVFKVISGLSEVEKQRKIDEIYQSNTSHRFNLSDDLMIVASYMKLGNGDKTEEDKQQGLAAATPLIDCSTLMFPS